jgi:hypothetical protein
MAVTPWDRAYWDRAVLVGPGKRIVISKTNLSETERKPLILAMKRPSSNFPEG